MEDWQRPGGYQHRPENVGFFKEERQQPMPPAPSYGGVMSEKDLPVQYKPLSAWAYFGYQILFAIPLIGWIILIVCAVNSENINRRNFARSYFCVLIIVAVIVVLVLVLAPAAGTVTNP